MPDRSLVLRLTDIVEAIERIRSVVGTLSPEEFEGSWERQWLVERGVLIVSEASRHLSTELKSRHPEIPWVKVAGIGSVLRHDYERIAPDVIWKLATVDLPILDAACRNELAKQVK
ncbi:MAG TPA: HepT-like ribonuclease domain-containing protein [Xanthobacteraceae bacterium]|nr:HepT-like ribonuclease domain-containing protein [Xanthobacteraceae bacterium]